MSKRKNIHKIITVPALVGAIALSAVPYNVLAAESNVGGVDDQLSTPSVFDINNNDIDKDKPDDVLGGDLIVCVPAELRLALTSNGNTVYTKADNVYAVGRTRVSDYLTVSTDTKITYLADDVTDALLADYPEAKVPGTISFGEAVEDQQISKWSATELNQGVGKKSVTEGVSRGISSTVQKEDITYTGSYSSTIWYNISLQQSEITGGGSETGNEQEDINKLENDKYFTKTVNDENMTCTITGLTEDGTEWLSLAVDETDMYGEKEADTLIIPNKIMVDNKVYTVTAIGENAFQSSDVQSVEMTDSVTNIGSYAFSFCWQLTSVNLSNNLTSISDGMFTRCEALEYIEIPESVKSIGESAFYRCGGLKSIEIPDNVINIGASAFASCTELKSVKLSNSITSITDKTFIGCSFTSIEIPKGVTSIGKEAFMNCNNLETVYYKGTKEEKANITIAEINSALEEANWICQN